MDTPEREDRIGANHSDIVVASPPESDRDDRIASNHNEILA